MPDNYKWEYDSPTGWGHVLGRTTTDLAERLEALAAEALSAANALRVPGGAA